MGVGSAGPFPVPGLRHDTLWLSRGPPRTRAWRWERSREDKRSIVVRAIEELADDQYWPLFAAIERQDGVHREFVRLFKKDRPFTLKDYRNMEMREGREHSWPSFRVCVERLWS